MAKKDISDEDRRLWQLYTRNINRTEARADHVGVKKIARSFKIDAPKVTTKKIFVRAPLSNFESLKNFDNNWGKKLKGGRPVLMVKLIYTVLHALRHTISSTVI